MQKHLSFINFCVVDHIKEKACSLLLGICRLSLFMFSLIAVSFTFWDLGRKPGQGGGREQIIAICAQQEATEKVETKPPPIISRIAD